jgi:hypothetical protein
MAHWPTWRTGNVAHWQRGATGNVAQLATWRTTNVRQKPALLLNKAGYA